MFCQPGMESSHQLLKTHYAEGLSDGFRANSHSEAGREAHAL